MAGVAKKRGKAHGVGDTVRDLVVSFVERAARAIAVAVVFLLCASVVATITLRWLRPPTTAFMLQARLEANREGRDDFRLRQQWVYLDAMSPHAGVAMIAAEDQQFAVHYGFDLDAIGDALRTRSQAGRMRGASTISQQVTKNLFLWPGRSLVRKAAEVYLTLLLETLVPKRRILELYVNIAQFGEGIYGVEAASRVFFAKSSSDLRPDEAALLAAVLPNPLKLRVDAPSEYVRERQRWIVEQMKQLGGPAYLAKLGGS